MAGSYRRGIEPYPDDFSAAQRARRRGVALYRHAPRARYQFTARLVELPEETALATTQAAIPTSISGAALEATHSRVVYEQETEDRVDFRSPLALGIVAALAFAVGTAGWLGWKRYEDRVGGAPVQIVLADFDGSTGDALLDRTLHDVQRFDLQQSPFLTVVSPAILQDLMIKTRHNSSDPLTVDLARDFCERTSSQAVLRGNLARAGQNYVITEEATNCADGTTLGTAAQTVSNANDLPRAMDRLSDSIRHQLGESRRTIARFTRPLSPQVTGALKALEDFSQALQLANAGRTVEPADLLKEAVALDPQFAAAWYNLYAATANLLDASASNSYLQKAYDTRAFATEPVRLTITARYQSVITGDLEGSARAYRLLTETYPRYSSGWNGLSLTLIQLGRYPEAQDAAKHHLDLFPTGVTAYQAFASTQMYNGDFAGAIATCRTALARGLDNETIRERLLLLGHLTGNTSLIAEQDDWLKQHPDSPSFLSTETDYAIAEGRVADSLKLLDSVDKAFRDQGQTSAGVAFRQGAALSYSAVGAMPVAIAQLHLGPVDSTNPDAFTALAVTGQPAAAAAMLRAQLAAHPQSTLWNRLYAPTFNARMALLNGDPERAIQLLQPAAIGFPYDPDTSYLLGLSLLGAGRYGEAETAFRTTLAHPGVNPVSTALPLSSLGLARALRRQNKLEEAAASYRQFLKGWARADTRLPAYQEAESELNAF